MAEQENKTPVPVPPKPTPVPTLKPKDYSVRIESKAAEGIKLVKEDEMVFMELNGKQTMYRLVPMSNKDVEDFYDVTRARI